MEGAVASCEGQEQQLHPYVPGGVTACLSQCWRAPCLLGSLIPPMSSAVGLVFFLSELQSPAVVRARNIVLGGVLAEGQEVNSHCELRLLLRRCAGRITSLKSVIVATLQIWGCEFKTC